jgi:hypothetical protein
MPLVDGRQPPADRGAPGSESERLAQRAVDQVVEEAVQFDQLVRELAARFGSLPPEQFDEAVGDAQRRILEALDLDRSAVFQFVNGQDLVMTHHWARAGLPAVPPAISAAREFPWSLGKIRSGEMAYFSAVEEVPDAVEREALIRYGSKSRVACPLSIDGRVVGALAFSPTAWPARGRRRSSAACASWRRCSARPSRASRPTWPSARASSCSGRWPTTCPR